MPSDSIPPRRVPIALGDRSYEISIGVGLLGQAATWEGLPRAAVGVVVSNPTVMQHWGAPLLGSLSPRFKRLVTIE